MTGCPRGHEPLLFGTRNGDMLRTWDFLRQGPPRDPPGPRPTARGPILSKQNLSRFAPGDAPAGQGRCKVRCKVRCKARHLLSTGANGRDGVALPAGAAPGRERGRGERARSRAATKAARRTDGAAASCEHACGVGGSEAPTARIPDSTHRQRQRPSPRRRFRTSAEARPRES